MSHSLIGRIYSVLVSIAGMSSIRPFGSTSHTSPCEADGRAPVPTGFRLGWTSGEARQEMGGRVGGREGRWTEHSLTCSLPVSS